MPNDGQTALLASERGPVEPFGAVTPPAPRSVAATIVARAWPYALLLAIGLFVLMPKLGDIGFWDPWEPKYSESVREMLEKDSYVVPYYRYEVRLTKPILVYWGIIAGSAVFGLNEFGARFVGICLCLASMIGVYYAVSLLRGRRAGLIAAIVLGTTPQFYFIGRQAMPDVYLFTSLGCCLLFFALGLFGPERGRNAHFTISYACCGLAVLAKGPMVTGAILIGTLAVFTAATVDLRTLWQPGTRLETLRFAVGIAVGALTLTAFGLISFVFGTSALWWGYGSEGRAGVGEIRQQILAASIDHRIADFLLVGLGIGLVFAALLAFRRLRGSDADRWTLAFAVASSAAAVVSWIAFAIASDERKVLVASLICAGIGAVLLPAATLRLLRHPPIHERVQPYLKPIGRQLALFAIVFTVVAGPWHVAIVIEQGHGYFTDFIVKHNISRAVSKINSTGATDFYMRTLIFGYFPWCAFIPIALASLVGWWERNPLRRYGLEIFTLVAAVTTFTIFSSAETKFPHYLAPMLVPLAVLIGLTIDKTIQHRNTLAARLTWIAAAMLYLLPMMDLIREDGARYLLRSFTVKHWIPDELNTGGYVLALIVAVMVFMLLSAIVRSRIVVGALLAVAVLMANYYTGTFIPELSRHKTLRNVTASYREYRMPGDPIGFHGDMKHGIFYYTEHEVELLSSVEEFMEFMDPAQPAFTVIELARLVKLRRPYQERYPGHELHTIDKSHFAYKLITNFEIPGFEPDED